jgi:hypothetical protein
LVEVFDCCLFDSKECLRDEEDFFILKSSGVLSSIGTDIVFCSIEFNKDENNGFVEAKRENNKFELQNQSLFKAIDDEDDILSPQKRLNIKELFFD